MDSIGEWFTKLRGANDVVMVPNERSEIAEFHLPSKVSDRPRYSLRELPEDIRAPLRIGDVSR
jgi:hypothetical protein